MAKIGDKRPAADEDSSEETKLTTPSAGGFTLMFKPSPLASVASNLNTYSTENKPSPKRTHKFTFTEVNDTAVKSPVKFTGSSIMKTETPRSLDNGARLLLKRSGENGGNDGEVPSKKTNLFIDCISKPMEASSTEHNDKTGFLFGEQLSSRAVVLNQSTTSKVSEESNKESSKATSSSTSSSPFGGVSQTSVLLPTVETVTGEEGERHVTQVSSTLFVFDSISRSWKERGRGELRLNDTPKSEGAYQSRLIMRTFGSRRVCLNTHLWSTMVCERSSKKTIKITAQEDGGEFGVYLIKGAPKDINNLYAAISRRLDALKIASSRDTTEPHPPQSLPSSSGCFDEDHDSVLGDRPSYCSSPESSPERQTERPITNSRYPGDSSSPSPSSQSSYTKNTSTETTDHMSPVSPTSEHTR